MLVFLFMYTYIRGHKKLYEIIIYFPFLVQSHKILINYGYGLELLKLLFMARPQIALNGAGTLLAN